jgi:hypothetical protein
LVLVSDEVDIGLAWRCWSWGSDLEVSFSVELPFKHVDDGLLLVLFWEDYFSLLASRTGWSLYENDVDVFVLSSWNSDYSGLLIYGLIRSNMNVDLNLN